VPRSRGRVSSLNHNMCQPNDNTPIDEINE